MYRHAPLTRLTILGVAAATLTLTFRQRWHRGGARQPIRCPQGRG